MDIQQTTETILSNLSLYGPWIMGLGTMISASCTPIPITVLVVASGVIIQQDGFHQVPLLLWGYLGVVTGDSICYLIGRHAMQAIRRLTRSRLDALWNKAYTWFDRNGGAAVFFSRWVFNPIDVPIGLVSGSTNFPFTRYLQNIVLGRLVWVILYGGLGFAVGAQWQALNEGLNAFQGWLIVILFLGVGLYFLRSRLQKKLFSPPTEI